MSKITDEKDLIVHLEIEKHIVNIIGIQQSIEDSIFIIKQEYNSINNLTLPTDAELAGNNENLEQHED